MTTYTETILKYASDDSRTGTLAQPDGIGEVGLGADEVGQKLAVRFMLKLTGDRVDVIRYQVFGCGFTMAACAAVAELAEGLPLTTLATCSVAAIEEQLGGLPKERNYCADLAAQALQAAVNSVATKGAAVSAVLDPSNDQGARIAETEPVFRMLIDSPAPADVLAEDRQLFACLLATADREPWSTAVALGLEGNELEAMLQRFFPRSSWQPKRRATQPGLPPEINFELRELLRTYIAGAPDRPTASWLADIIAARAAHPGHLWVAMGLFERPQLSAAIGRHLPSLLAANDKKMRWKRYLFKQLCEMSGGMMCKSPVCGDCSDYALCFVPGDDS